MVHMHKHKQWLDWHFNTLQLHVHHKCCTCKHENQQGPPSDVSTSLSVTLLFAQMMVQVRKAKQWLKMANFGFDGPWKHGKLLRTLTKTCTYRGHVPKPMPEET